MRRISLIVGVVGLAFLVGFLLIDGFEVNDLDGLIVGDVVSVSGIVEQQRDFGNGILITIGNIPVFCECFEEYLGKRVFVDGIVERFPEDLRVKAFFIKIID